MTKKLEAYTVSLPSNAQRQALADHARERRVAMARQEYKNWFYAGTDRRDGTRVER